MRRKLSWFLTCLAILAGDFVVSRISFTQSPKQERIAGPIAGSPAVWLEGNRRPMFLPENDQGPAPDSLKLENITLMFKPTENQQANLAALLEQQQDRSSPLYHHWLAPEQFADNFGLSPSDVAQVAAWLQSQGFTLIQTARSRLWVSFSGTAAQVASAFHTEIHYYSVDGKTYYANASEPSVPAALSDVVQGFISLDNYGPKPRGVFHQVEAGPKPDFTSYLSGNPFLAPADFAIIYDLNALYNENPPIDGTGQSIAVMGQTDFVMSDITTFRSLSGLPAKNPTVVLNGTDPGLIQADINEASLDIEWSGAVAPNATIIYVNSTDAINGSLYYAIDQDLAPVISISYGDCEANWGSANLKTLGQMAQEANTQGQTILSAAGDSGAADCDYSTSTTTVTSATHGLAVDAPASSPNVTGMGGSEFNEGTGNYWLPANNGVDVSPSALSYIPEMVWNDTSSPENTGNGLLAGGGGVSTVFTKPSWQTEVTPSDGFRDVPDLSLNASPLHNGLLVCVQGSCVNGYRGTAAGGNLLTVAGGTSAAAPTFAGIVALINQQMNTLKGQGNINPTLYSMAATSPAAFHDITTGNNIVPCTSGSTGCPASGQIGYTAVVGYDPASGLGSVDAFNLVTAWNSTLTGNLPAPILTAPANGAAAVALLPPFSWTAVSGNAGYRIMIATSPTVLPTNPGTIICSACTVVDMTPTNSTSYTPPSALAAGAYYWQVQAIEPSSSSGNAAWSNIFSFTTTGGSLPAPTLSAPGNGATAVLLPPTFTWTSVIGSTGYRILIATTQSALPINPAVGTCGGCSLGVTTTATSYTPSTALDAATTYYWEVQALPSGSGQNAFWSSVSSFTTGNPDFSLSASPSTLAISPGNSGTSTLTLTPINNFSATPNLTCSASSSLAGVTCTVGPLGGNNTATVTITASSAATSYPALPRNPRFGAWWVAGVAMLCHLLIALCRLRQGSVPAFCRAERRSAQGQRRWPLHVWLRPEAALWNLRLAAIGAILAALLVASLSCGGGSSGGGGGTTAPPPESGAVTVTGTSSTLSHTAQVSVSVS